MTTDNSLARRPIEISTIDDAERLARIAVASGLTPLRRPEEAAVILLTGRELGLAPMQSLRGIHVVQGRPVLSADLMVAIVRRSGLCASWRTVESTPEVCTIETRREGETDPARKTWTMADAARAGLTAKGGNWKAYPTQMLRHRCAADLAREVYPDVVLGLYDPDEMGAVEPRGTLDAVVVEPQRPLVDLAHALSAIDEAATCEATRAAYVAAQDALRRVVSLDAPEAAEPLATLLRAAVERMVAIGLSLPASKTRQVVADDDLAALADEMLTLRQSKGAEAIVGWWLSVAPAIHPGVETLAREMAARCWAGITADADKATVASVSKRWRDALAAPPAPPPAEEHGLVTALREHLAAKPSGAAPGTREHTSQLAAVAQSYLKRLPEIADAGREDEALVVVRAELVSRGCTEPDALIAKVDARRKGAAKPE